MNKSPLVISNISVRQDSEGRYCLNDLHKAAGGNQKNQPSNFIRLSSTKELCEEIERSSKVRSVHRIQGGKVQGTYVCKELVYSYAMWISASFNLKVIRAYDDLVSKPKAEQSISTSELTKAQINQIQAIIDTPKITLEVHLLPPEQEQEIMQRFDKLLRMFHPMSEQFSDVHGILRALRGLHPKLGLIEEGYIQVMPDFH